MEPAPRNAIILARLSGLRGDDERGIQGQVRDGYDYARLKHRAAAEPRGDREQRDRGVWVGEPALLWFQPRPGAHS
jgi:hypothetical protein